MAGLVCMVIYEMIATCLFIMMQCGGLVDKDLSSDSTYYGLYIGLCGLMIVHIFGFLSGSILIPSITIASYLNGFLAIDKTVAYLVAQFVGSLIGYQLLNLLIGSGKVVDANLCLAASETAEPMQIAVIEFLITTVLIFGLISMRDRRNQVDVLPVRFAILLAGCNIVGVLSNGVGLNTAIIVAAAASTQTFDNLEYYVGGQLVAAIIAPVLWKVLFAKRS